MTSYGGYLRFTLQYTVAYDSGRAYRDVDLELVSGDQRFYYLFNPATQPEEYNKVEILLREVSTENCFGTFTFFLVIIRTYIIYTNYLSI